jgi:hypothetical protein
MILGPRTASAEAKTLGFRSAPKGESIFSVASDLSIVAATLINHGSAMSALGQKQPLKTDWILASEWLLSGHTGHSPLRISGDASGCFRPEADDLGSH